MKEYIDPDFDPMALLFELQAANQTLARALIAIQDVNQSNHERINNLLVIVQNQQQQIDIVWNRQEHMEAQLPNK
jgi:hypothetical protein